jgi:hypothetical protein
MAQRDELPPPLTGARRVRRLYPGAERTINIGAAGRFNLV